MPNSKTKSNATEIQTLTTKVAEILQSDLESIYERACKEYQIKYTDEITALKAEIAELSRSQDFISKQYDEIIKLNSKKMEDFDELKQKHDSLCTDYSKPKTDYNALKLANEKQTNQLDELMINSADLEKKSNSEAVKLDAIDQYSRRQNLEFLGISVTANEDVIDIVVKLGKLVGVDIAKSDISTAHSLRPKRHSTIGEPPAIIARFINRNLRNLIYSKRTAAKLIPENDFPISKMKRLYINENLTQERKKLLWQTKQRMKQLEIKFLWTMNGKIYVRKDEDSTSVIIQNEEDLNKIEH